MSDEVVLQARGQVLKQAGGQSLAHLILFEVAILIIDRLLNHL